MVYLSGILIITVNQNSEFQITVGNKYKPKETITSLVATKITKITKKYVTVGYIPA